MLHLVNQNYQLIHAIVNTELGNSEENKDLYEKSMRWAGLSSSFLPFEPASTAWQAAVLDQARYVVFDVLVTFFPHTF